MSEKDSTFWLSGTRYEDLVRRYEEGIRVRFTNPSMQYFGRWPKTNPRKMEYHGENV